MGIIKDAMLFSLSYNRENFFWHCLLTEIETFYQGNIKPLSGLECSNMKTYLKNIKKDQLKTHNYHLLYTNLRPGTIVSITGAIKTEDKKIESWGICSPTISLF